VDKVLAMAKGQVQAFGPKSEVLRQVLQAAPAPKPAASATPPPLPPAARPPWGTAGLRVIVDGEAGGDK
jgi:hypothetical protein